jgi:hypothetical protein
MRSVVRSLAALVGSGALILSLAPAQALLLVPVQPVEPGGPNRFCGWPINYPADANYSWPDTDAAYFVQTAFLEAGEELIITGRDPKARYWSLQTYNYRDRAVIDSVNDEQVKRVGKGAKRTWTVTVTTSPSRTGDNTLQGAEPFVPPEGRLPDLDNEAHQLTVLIYRVYRSETASPGGGPLPTVSIKTKDGRRQALKPCASNQVGPPDNPVVLERQPDVPADFVRAPDGPFYPSYDTSYLVAQRAYDPEKVLVVTGKAPRVRKDLRYWSLCQNINIRPLPVVDCVSDRDVTLTKGRYTIAVVTPEQVLVADRAKYRGVTFIEWGDVNAEGVREDALLLFRHILPKPAFRQSVKNVRPGQPATSTMGEYAPVISQVPLSELAAR